MDRSRVTETRSERWRHGLVATLLVGGLLALHAATSEPRVVLDTLRVPSLDTAAEGAALAAIRFSEPLHIDATTVLRAEIRGQGQMRLALIDEGEEPAPPRELALQVDGDAEGVFEAVKPGEYAVRAIAQGGPLELRLSRGRGDTLLLLIAIALVLAPLLWRSLRRLG